ncbi:MAG: TIGR02301 family protein [Alphaproteobacteria bacterium]|nr:TIGR02301 family protein [Alphaproteobacteria bacterium]
MDRLAKQLLILAFGAFWLAFGTVSFAPNAEAQFFRWFQPDERPKQAPRRVKPKPPGDDLPAIVPRESTAPPPPDDRPYDTKLMRLAEILGAVHYLRELCGAEEGQVWRDQMKEILKNEGTTAARRAKLVNSFNDGYRGYRRTYRACTESATLASTRFSTEGATIAASLAQTSVFAPKAEAKTDAAPEASQDGGETAAASPQAEAKPAERKPAEPPQAN